MAAKPFRGVLRTWTRIGPYISARIVWHKDHNTRTGEFAPDHRIRTSNIVAITSVEDGFHLVETENSFYVLLDNPEWTRGHEAGEQTDA